ncbi:MAG: hypothetical protein KGS72_11890 [Cyanobacteria bacterium REEB67]|nr:hypothetical protein [Cyanobacteria bacterium REEB67]
MQFSTHPSTRSIREAGEPVPTSHAAINSIVHRTAMHSQFMVGAIYDWVVLDNQRQENGVPDDLAYLTGVFSFVMKVIQLQLDFAGICAKEKENKEKICQGMETVLATLKQYRLDTSRMEGNIKMMRLQDAQLAATVAVHQGTTEQISDILARLQARVDAVLMPAGSVAARTQLH